jgi:hypothetical protein
MQRLLIANAGLAWTLLPSSEQAGDQRYDEQDQEDEKEYFCNFRGACSNAPESEDSGDERNDEKYQRVVEHL